MFDRCYSTKNLLKFGKKYGTIFCHRFRSMRISTVYLNYRLPGPRASKDSRLQSSFFLYVPPPKVRGGGHIGFSVRYTFGTILS